MNGFLAGLVAITAPCYWVSPTGSFFIGLVAGVTTFFALGHWGIAENNGVASAARGLFYLPQEGDWRSLAWFLLVPLAATAIALITSRITLKRMLGDIQ